MHRFSLSMHIDRCKNTAIHRRKMGREAGPDFDARSFGQLLVELSRVPVASDAVGVDALCDF